ncbi:hypothetical protein [Halocalculus aciditolerans]|uniref:Uncharacterized protein n=1 Tax=Halocalculus aciditolerans TaxID=1383812 RepID=A0A830FAF8_9EURY|nr:hypothetical protein [Halocalculus aciditolerans]GGL55097.1 hypothetical protein GCM10009039_11500 [Halocalculus aciditolerans]
MTGENVYLSERALEVLDDVQSDFEDRYGFEPSLSQAIISLADGHETFGDE